MREPIKGFGLLSDFAIRRARTVLGRERMTRHHPALNREAAVFEAYAQELARVTAQVLRKHGRDIAEMQYTQKRTAEMAIDLYAIAACAARTTRPSSSGARRGAARDRSDAYLRHRRRAEARTARRDVDKNDDELRKAVASKAYVDGRYPFDLL